MVEDRMTALAKCLSGGTLDASQYLAAVDEHVAIVIPPASTNESAAHRVPLRGLRPEPVAEH